MISPTSCAWYHPARAGKTVFRRASALLFGLTASVSSLAAQVEGEVAATTEPVLQLARLVRWGGVATSVVVIIVVYLGLRFLDSIVDEIGRASCRERV